MATPMLVVPDFIMPMHTTLSKNFWRPSAAVGKRLWLLRLRMRRSKIQLPVAHALAVDLGRRESSPASSTRAVRRRAGRTGGTSACGTARQQQKRRQQQQRQPLPLLGMPEVRTHGPHLDAAGAPEEP